MSSGNWIRACFRLAERTPKERLLALLEALDQLDCRFNVWRAGHAHAWLQPTGSDETIEEAETSPQANLVHLQQLAQWQATPPGECLIDFGWRVLGSVQAARLLQSWLPERSPRVPDRHLWFDIYEEAFPGRPAVQHRLQDDLLLLAYNQLITAIVQHVAPALGVIDYEADFDDLACPYPYWGLYLSGHFLARWQLGDWRQFIDLVDAKWQLPRQGMLVYMQPLVDSAMTKADSRLATLLARNWHTATTTATFTSSHAMSR